MSAASNDDVAEIVIEVHDRVANDLNNRKRKELFAIEEDRDVRVEIVSRADVCPEHLKVICKDENGRSFEPKPSGGKQPATSGRR